MDGQRLAKVMAQLGVASRRRCEQLVFAGRVRVNDQTITHPATKVDPDRDRIEVDGNPVRVDEPKQYLVVYKPRGVISTCNDPRGRQTVLDLIPSNRGRLYPVGRLDSASEGLVILTNDGDLALLLTHPRFQAVKVYLVTVRGHPDGAALDRISRGIELDDGLTAPAEVDVVSSGEDRTVLRLSIREGKKRQIRRMMESQGHDVLRLKRIAIGPIQLGSLRPGTWRVMTPDEIRMVRDHGRKRREPSAGLDEPWRPKKRRT